MMYVVLASPTCSGQVATVAPQAGSRPIPNTVGIFDRSRSTQTNVPITIPRFFKKGDIAHHAQPTINGTPAATWQCDAKNRWEDGSLKFAIVSVVIPQLPANRNVTIGFVDNANRDSGGQGKTPTGYLTKADMLNPAYDFEATMRLTGVASHTVSARAILSADKFRYWLQGPVVTAVIVEDREGRSFDVNTDGAEGNPLHPIFEAWFYPQTHKVEVGFTIENTWASSIATKSARNQDYSLTLTTGFAAPAVHLTQATFTQFSFTRWRRGYWVGLEPPAVRYDWNPQYLLQTTAYPNWDTNHLPDSRVAASEYAVYANFAKKYPARLTIPGFDDPEHAGIVNYDQAINAAGDSAFGSWIGLYPTWDIDYLLTGDPNLQKMMTDNADLAGRFPMWFREADHHAGSGHYFDYPKTGHVDPYGHVVSINARQQVTLALYNWDFECPGEASDKINAGAPLRYGNWPALDASHMPAFGFIPYTLTGKYYYLEQQEMEAGYEAGFRNGCTGPNDWWRQGYLGLLELLVRDQAWSIRELAYGAFIAPDGDPEGPYFRDKLLNNIARMEGEHGLPLDITDTADRRTAYNWGRNTAYYTQAANPSPLGAWQIDSASEAYAQNGRENNVNPKTLSNAGSMFMEAFLNISLGMVRQLGVANTKELLTFAAKRPFHILLDPSVNHYLIGQYCYPSKNKDGSWVADWSTFQSGYLVVPTQWGAAWTTDDLRGFQQMSGVSFMTDITVDNINGQAVWNWYKKNKPNQSELQSANIRWGIRPLGQ